MIEKDLITALERMQSYEHLNEKFCDHEWVNRKDGWEETCGAAICCICGEYGCWCTANWREMTDKQKKAFEDNGINGNNWELKKKLKAAKNNKNRKVCLQPSNYGKSLGCVKCESLLVCTDRENRHCEECLLFNLESQGNCEEPGYGTKADNNACDRFKLKVLPNEHKKESEFDLGKVKHPICPFNLYFEGDEDKIDLSKCDFENRSCTNACDPNSTRRL